MTRFCGTTFMLVRIFHMTRHHVNRIDSADVKLHSPQRLSKSLISLRSRHMMMSRESNVAHSSSLCVQKTHLVFVWFLQVSHPFICVTRSKVIALQSSMLPTRQKQCLLLKVIALPPLVVPTSSASYSQEVREPTGLSVKKVAWNEVRHQRVRR